MAQTNIIIPLYPTSYDTTLSILKQLNDINNITISLISLKSFFGEKESNDFVSKLINEANSPHRIMQVWMDEIFLSYNIFPAIYPGVADEFKYFEIVKIFIPYIRELSHYNRLIYIEHPITIDDINTLINTQFENGVQVITLENTSNIIDNINNDFKNHKSYNNMSWDKFKGSNDIIPADTRVIVYNIKYFNEIFTKSDVSVNRQIFTSILDLQRLIEFKDYMDALVSLCYNYKTIKLNLNSCTEDANASDNAASTDTTEDIPKDVPEDVPNAVSEDAPEDVPKDVPKDNITPQDVPTIKKVVKKKMKK